MGLGIGRRLKRMGRSIERGAKKLGKKVEKGIKTGGKSVIEAQGKVAGGGVPESVEEVGEALAPEINIPAPEQEAVMPIPDEELSRSARRRARARRRGGRSSSILTGGDSLGGY